MDRWNGLKDRGQCPGKTSEVTGNMNLLPLSPPLDIMYMLDINFP